MASTVIIPLPIDQNPANGAPWVKVAAGQSYCVVQNLTSAAVVLFCGPAAQPPAAGAEGRVLAQEFEDFDFSGIMSATDKVWARAYSRAGRVVAVRS